MSDNTAGTTPTTPQGVPPRPAPPVGYGQQGTAGPGLTGSQPTLPQPPYVTGAFGQPQPPLAAQQPQGPAPQQAAAYEWAPPAERSKKKKSGAGVATGIIVAAALVGGAAGLGGAYAGVQLFAPQETAVVAENGAITINNPDEVSLTTAIAAKVVPSVVTISASGAGSGGTGSGAILTSDGYVVTNTHVVTLDGATGEAQVTATTSDGRVYQAEIVGTDPLYDLAVIKLIGAEGLTPVEFADSADLNVGDMTVAVGAPLGLSSTVTTGIVSALHRSIRIASAAAPDTPSEEQPEAPGGDEDAPFFFDFGQGPQNSASAEPITIAVVQTDAAINPGNSGGPLVDSAGNLIGINVAIASATEFSGSGGGSIGVGFAIPSNVVERVAGELIENGTATHGLLGAMVGNAAAVQGATISGAAIQEVTDGGAAQQAGLRAGDIVVSFNGVPITDASDLTAQVRAAAAGSDATVTYVRDGQTHTLDVVLGSL